MSVQPEMPWPHELPDRVGIHRHGDGSVLLSAPHTGSFVLSGLSDAETTAVLGLGPAMRRDRTHVSPSARWAQVLAHVHQAAARLLADPARSGTVVVLGDGPLPREIRRALAPLVARVVPESEALAALQADAAIHPPDLVVLPAVDAVDALAGHPWQVRGVPQLPVVVSGDILGVGPLVRADVGPCLRCLDVHRGARDPDWASWMAVRAGAPDDEIDAPPELLATAGALTALIVSGHQRQQQPLPPGVSVSVRRPQPRVHHHLWTRHPSCCGSTGRRVTMGA